MIWFMAGTKYWSGCPSLVLSFEEEEVVVVEEGRWGVGGCGVQTAHTGAQGLKLAHDWHIIQTPLLYAIMLYKFP